MDMETAGCAPIGSGAVVGTFISWFLSWCTPDFSEAFPKEHDQFRVGSEVDLPTGVHFFHRAFELAAHDLAAGAQPEYECSPHDKSQVRACRPPDSWTFRGFRVASTWM